MTPHPPADRFRVGDVWRSPRGRDWECYIVENGMAGLHPVGNLSFTQWIGIYDTGRNMLSAWQRITPPQEN
jgi:hypothetical protein